MSPYEIGAIARAFQAVNSFPSAPKEGEFVRLLNPQTLTGYTTLVVGVVGGLGNGFARTEPRQGSLTPESDKIISFYGATQGIAALRGKLVFVKASTETRNFTRVDINGVAYTGRPINGVADTFEVVGLTSNALQSCLLYTSPSPRD